MVDLHTQRPGRLVAPGRWGTIGADFFPALRFTHGNLHQRANIQQPRCRRQPSRNVHAAGLSGPARAAVVFTGLAAASSWFRFQSVRLRRIAEAQRARKPMPR
jgi:hypothetical protein